MSITWKITLAAMGIALTCGTITVAGAQLTVIEVILISDPREPDLGEDDLRSALHRAEGIVQKVCGREVRLALRQHVMLDDYFASLERGIVPFMLTEELAHDPLHIDPAALRGRVDEASLIPYLQSLQRVRSYTALDGSPLFNEGNWHQHNMAYWITCLASQDWTPDYRLYLTNTLLLDTTLQAMPPAAIANGAVLSMFDMPSSRSAMVTYDGILRGTSFSQAEPIRDLSPAQKCDALTYLIAHCAGIDLLLGRDAEDAPDAGLARPLSALRDVEDFTNLARMRLRPGSANTARYRRSLAYKVCLRMDIFIAQGKWDDACAECARAMDLPLDDAAMAEVFARAERCQDELEKRRNPSPNAVLQASGTSR